MRSTCATGQNNYSDQSNAQAEVVAGGVGEVLFDAEVAFGRLNGSFSNMLSALVTPGRFQASRIRESNSCSLPASNCRRIDNACSRPKRLESVFECRIVARRGG